MDFSRPSKHLKNELLTQTLSVPNKVDELACPSTTSNNTQRLSITLFRRYMDILIACRQFHCFQVLRRMNITLTRKHLSSQVCWLCKEELIGRYQAISFDSFWTGKSTTSFIFQAFDMEFLWKIWSLCNVAICLLRCDFIASPLTNLFTWW